MAFVHAVDRSGIPTVNILGVAVAAIDMDWLMGFTCRHVHELSGDYICAVNVHSAVMSGEDAEYRSIQNGGILAIPDGGPLASLGRRRGQRQMARTPGPSYMGEVFKISAERGFRHYFYGSTPETLEKLAGRLARSYPGLQVAGMFSPPFRPMTEREDGEAVARINEAGPDFLWVGLGAPKQERWMAAHQGRVKGLMVGVGAGFDYHAGNIRRAPEWMQRRNLEWLCRLAQDPRRLFRRYMTTNAKFLWNAVARER